MRILLDECVNPRLRLAFPGHEVKTVAEMGWRSLSNGRLLAAAQSEFFDTFVTLDQNLGYQNRPMLAVLVIRTPFNDLAFYRPHFTRIRDAVVQVKVGEVRTLEL